MKPHTRVIEDRIRMFLCEVAVADRYAISEAVGEGSFDSRARVYQRLRAMEKQGLVVSYRAQSEWGQPHGRTHYSATDLLRSGHEASMASVSKLERLIQEG